MEFVTFASSPARPPQAHGAGGSREAVAEKIIRQGAAHICCNRRRRRRAAQAFRNVLQTRKVELNKERERAESTSDITGPVSAAMLCRRSRLAEGPTRRETEGLLLRKGRRLAARHAPCETHGVCQLSDKGTPTLAATNAYTDWATVSMREGVHGSI